MPLFRREAPAQVRSTGAAIQLARRRTRSLLRACCEAQEQAPRTGGVAHLAEAELGEAQLAEEDVAEVAQAKQRVQRLLSCRRRLPRARRHVPGR